MTPGDDSASAAVLARRRCPHFTPTEVLARTGKSLLVAGTYTGQPAVAKLLTDSAGLWRQRFAAEAYTYQVFATHRPPVPAPRLLAANPEAGMLMLEHVTGWPAATDRHPTVALDPQAASAVAAAADMVAAWRPPDGVFTAVFDYSDRFARYGPRGHGLLSGDDVDRLQAVYTACAAVDDVWVFTHGDALPGNVLLGDDTVTLLDWEWAGLYLPGFDHALLWTVLSADPATRARLQASATTGNWHHRAGFWVNAAMTVTREIRTHRDLPPSPPRRRILASLDDSLTVVRGEFARLAETVRSR